MPQWKKNLTSRNMLFWKKLYRWTCWCNRVTWLFWKGKYIPIGSIEHFLQMIRQLAFIQNWQKLIKKKLEGKVRYCRKKSEKNTQSGYLISADENILPDVINAFVTGEGVTKSVQLKAIWHLISIDIEDRKKISWLQRIYLNQMNFEICISVCLIWSHGLLVRLLLWEKNFLTVGPQR